MFNFYDCLRQLKTPLRLPTIIWKPALKEMAKVGVFCCTYTNISKQGAHNTSNNKLPILFVLKMLFDMEAAMPRDLLPSSTM